MSEIVVRIPSRAELSQFQRAYIGCVPYCPFYTLHVEVWRCSLGFGVLGGSVRFESPGPSCPGPGTYRLVKIEEAKA